MPLTNYLSYATVALEGGNMNLAEAKTTTYPPGAYVEIWSYDAKGEKSLRARCVLKKDGTVQCLGEDADLVARLYQDGVSIVLQGEPQYFKPGDGIAFLQAVSTHFSNPYLLATPIQMPATRARRSKEDRS